MVNENRLFSHVEDISLYIHVPFCASKCIYCDFYSKVSGVGVNTWLEGVQAECSRLIDEIVALKDRRIKSIFVGGGTPSLLSVGEWQRLTKILRSSFNLSSVSEWTIECNPDSYSCEKAEAWLDSGVTRLSIGVQSLDDNLLKRLGRVHGADDVRSLFRSPQIDRFNSVGVDLIYALPGQTLESLSSTVKEILLWPQVKHVSAYELTLAEDTALWSMKNELIFPEDELVEDMVSLMRSALEEAGMERYEVSNYAKRGFRSIHNSSYWDFTPYLGVGPSAHSFDGRYRWSNPASIEDWISRVSSPEYIVIEDNSVGFEEYLSLRLRTVEGINIADFIDRFGLCYKGFFESEEVEFLRDRGVLSLADGHLYLSKDSLDLADGVALRLMGEL